MAKHKGKNRRGTGKVKRNMMLALCCIHAYQEVTSDHTSDRTCCLRESTATRLSSLLLRDLITVALCRRYFICSAGATRRMIPVPPPTPDPEYIITAKRLSSSRRTEDVLLELVTTGSGRAALACDPTLINADSRDAVCSKRVV